MTTAGNAFLAALNVVDPAKPGVLYKPQPGTKLVAVDAVVGNAGSGSVSVNVLNFSLVDADGFAVTPELGGCDAQIDTVSLKEGDRVRGLVCFEVPAKAVPATLKYQAGGLLDSKTLVVGLKKPSQTVQPKYPERSAPKLTKLGETAESPSISLMVSAFEEKPKPGILYRSRAGYKLVAAEIIIGNPGANKLSVNPLYVRLVDSNGFLWEAELGGRDGKQLDSGDIDKGEKVKGWVAFTIPTDAVPSAIRVDADVFGDVVAYAGLSK